VPVFEGLFPQDHHNKAIVDLLYTLTDWHALAKLAIHTDSTLERLEIATTQLGDQIRHFSDVIGPEFTTFETPAELAKRKRRAASSNQSGTTGATERRKKGFNLETYKLHALGDYPSDIRNTGSTVGYSTQSVSILISTLSVLTSKDNRVKAAIKGRRFSTP
jgi:hypothetical protein